MKQKITMSDAALEERRKYLREWAKTHPENIRRNRARYWEKKAAQAAAAQEETPEIRQEA